MFATALRCGRAIRREVHGRSSLEDAISSRVAEAIVPHLSGDDRIRLAKRGTDDPQAHEAYLRGRYFWNTFTEEGFAKAVVCYHEAIAADPHYAVAYAGIAEYYNGWEFLACCHTAIVRPRL